MRPQMQTAEEPESARGWPRLKGVMDDGSSGGIGREYMVVYTEQGRAMVAVSVPRLAASIARHVFDGLLLKACPSRRVRDMVAQSSSHPQYRWQREFYSGSVNGKVDINLTRKRVPADSY